MSDLSNQQDSEAAAGDDLEGLYGATDAVVREAKDAISHNRAAAIRTLIAPLHAADLADLIEHLTQDERDILVTLVGADLDPELFTYLDETVREDVIEDLDTEQIAEVVQELESDDAVDLIEDLDQQEQAEVLRAVAPEDRALLEDALRYPEDSAGRLMNREAATVPVFWT
ncbi:MAG: magnesium transporter, partial [Alphaproteobacteria bacterium]|nr:magnesium transporter [Alphaproteobacteria bacterium]